MIILELFWRFVVLSLLAFGGGQAALPLVEYAAVHETRWITAAMFGTAVALAYITPGPVLIVATFVGYQVAGIPGALAATLGAFVAPWAMAVVMAREIGRFVRYHALAAFGRTAAAAAVGLFGATTLDVGRAAIADSWSHLGLAGLVLVLAATGRVNPVVLLGLGGLVGLLLPG